MISKGEIPFVRLLIPLILGISTGWFWPNKFLFNQSLYLLFLLLGIFVVLLITYKKFVLYRAKWTIGLLVHAYILIVGYTLTISNTQQYEPQYFTHKAAEVFLVKVTNEPKLTGDILRFESEVTQSIEGKAFSNVCGKLLIALKTDSIHPRQFSYGDLLLIPARFNEVEPPYNPGEFDFRAYLKGQQIYEQAFINQQQVKLIRHHSGNLIIDYVIYLRKQLVDKFYKYLPDKETAALASTLILGYRADLSKEVISAYSKTGTMHVLSVSGMHVGIVFLVLSFLLKPLNRNQNLRLFRAVLMILVIWFYSLISGFCPAVCRAAMMLTFIVLSKAMNRNLNTYNLLAISAFFLLLYNPFYLFDVGFQLSYLAVIGLVYLHPKIYHLLYIKNKLLDTIWSYCALSIAAQLATFPISIYYFHQFPLYFLFSNLFIVLPVAAIMYAGIAFLFIPWPVILKPLGWLLSWLITFTDNILFYIENLPFSSLNGIWINTFQYVLMYIVIGCLIWAGSVKSKYAVWCTMLSLIVLSISFSYQAVLNNNRQELIFYSLRKNTAIGYINQNKSYVITDLKPSDKTIGFSIKPYLDSRGASQNKISTSSDSLVIPTGNIQPNFMQFGNYKVLRWNKDFDHQKFKNSLKVDAVLLSGNPQINLVDMNRYILTSLVLIDGTNPDYKIKQWKQQAEELKMPCHILKKNPAYIVQL